MLDLVVFSHLRWDFVHQRPQHLMSRLGREQRVFFVEEPEHTSGPPTIASSSPCEGVTVLRPRTSVEATGFDDAQVHVIEPLLRQCLGDHGVRDAVAWFYTPMALPLLDAVPARAVVYDCMDELSAYNFAPAALRQFEAALLLCADLVLTGGPSQCEAKRSRHPNVHCFPSAVDAAHFAPVPGHADDSPIAHPRLGFFGVIDERLDLDLIGALARAEPTWQVVMAGPVVKIDPARLPREPNIHWLDQQPYAALPALVQGWQVCLMPFALNAATRFISPTKSLVYMAAEKPVVSTAVPDVVTLHGEQVRVARDTQGFIQACREALAEDAAERVVRVATMRAALTRTSWNRTVDAMRVLVDAAVHHSDEQRQSEQAARSHNG